MNREKQKREFVRCMEGEFNMNGTIISHSNKYTPKNLTEREKIYLAAVRKIMKLTPAPGDSELLKVNPIKKYFS